MIRRLLSQWPLIMPLILQSIACHACLYDGPSFLKKLAAIGDSYAAGIGAGDRLGSLLGVLDPTSDWACSRHDHAYPYIVNNDPRLGDPSGRKVPVPGLLRSSDQRRPLEPDTVCRLGPTGGSAVNCREQVALAKTAAMVDKEYQWGKDVDRDRLGRGCDRQLDRSESVVKSEAFNSNVDKILDAAKAKRADDAVIYHTGYGKLFSENLSPEYDSVSWVT
ncbi:hypothetical protein DL768_010499 [Monosporascus sp. mg162]|nr:hypothetical protein DL768_010499 [Monosporascus sp. mg162]